MLQKQKRKHGVAILGQPVPQLDFDIKFQGGLKQDCIRSGEALALASLTAEMVVLDVCKIPKDQYNKYTGRSQHPKLKTKM
jgi:hypothetical protein